MGGQGCYITGESERRCKRKQCTVAGGGGGGR